jgi:hypothetical protein
VADGKPSGIPREIRKGTPAIRIERTTEIKLMKWIIQIGAVLALVGGIGLAMPVFTTSQTRDVASLGDLKIQSTEQSAHVVPWTLSAGALMLGLILMGTGVYTKRGALA